MLAFHILPFPSPAPLVSRRRPLESPPGSKSETADGRMAAPDPGSSAADEALFYEGEESEGEPSDSEAHAEWTDRLPTAAELLGLESLDEVHAHGGAPVQHEFDLNRLIQLCYDGWSIEAMAEELGVPARVIRYRKTQLGLTWLVQQPWLPSRETLDEWWSLNPGITVGALAVALSVSATTLRRHMRHAGFKPSAGSGTDEEVLRAIRTIHSRKFVSKLGRTNLDGALRDEYGIVATDRQIRRSIKQIDPRGTKKRAKQAGKAQRQYRVGGPRSLYHADAHEKIAKKYGIWLHLLIDGYSRFIIYLSAAPDKRAETVRRLYVTACNIVGWPSRCRWDKGRAAQATRLETGSRRRSNSAIAKLGQGVDKESQGRERIKVAPRLPKKRRKPPRQRNCTSSLAAELRPPHLRTAPPAPRFGGACAQRPKSSI